MDTKNYIERLIEKHEYRRSPKGLEAMTSAQQNLYEIIKYLVELNRNRIVLREDIGFTYKSRFGTELNLLPTDFCYNSINVGPDFESKFSLRRERGSFEFVGFNWPAEDKQVEIKWSPTGKDVPEELKGKTFIVGTYHKGEYSWDFERNLARYTK